MNNKQATKEKFITNPFGAPTQNKLYKTGDLVKWHAHGVLEYRGRSDNQVKIRGYRIELSEIECALEKIPSIHQCIVVPELEQNGLLSLSAYLVLGTETELNASSIRAQLNKTLPDHMIPSRYFAVSALFSTPGGKLDRKNIPTPLKQLGLNKHSREPSSKIEYELRNLWMASLKIDTISIDDDFFNLGGTSLSAMEIITSIQKKFGITVTMRTIFEYPTIYALASIIENLHKNINIQVIDAKVNNPVIPIKKRAINPPLFLIHPIGGSIFWYKNLGNYLDKNQPLYGIQDPGLDNHDFLFNSLEEMATHYINAVQTIQPKGPYLLGGASFGCTVAIEMAKQLQEQGESVIAIISLDGWAYYPSLQNDKDFFQKMMREHNEKLLTNYMEYNITNPQFLLKLQWHREQMLTRYKLPMIETKFILFKAQELSPMFQYEADLNWWENYVKDSIELYIASGDHETMFSEFNIPNLAAKMNEVINTILIESGNFNNTIDHLLLDSTS